MAQEREKRRNVRMGLILQDRQGSSKPLLFAPAPVLEKRPPRPAAALEPAPALAKIWNGSRYLRVLGDAVKRALMSARRESRSTIPIEVGE
jgi:hypothetical protein